MSLSFIRLIRAQSVFEAREEDNFFFLGRPAEGDDVDFIFSLGVNNGNSGAVQKAEGYELLFPVPETVVFIGESRTFKHVLRVDEVKTVSI